MDNQPIIDYTQGTGLIPSPKDYRDIPAEAVLPAVEQLPNQFLFSKPLAYINQGQLPYCVACTGSTMEEALQQVLGNPDIQFDWQWLYQQCKLIDGLPGMDGTTFKAMLTVLKNTGCKPIGTESSDSDTISKYKIAGYVQVNTDLQSLKTAIFNCGVILMGFTGSNPGWQTAIIRPPLPGESTWNHATSGKGYTPITIKVQNSWGLGWGDNGDFDSGEEYPPFESWAILQTLPVNWESLFPQVNNKPKFKFNNQMGAGSQIPDVIQLQKCMQWIGCMSIEVPNAQNFGPMTLESVKLYQKRNNIPATGFVGALTLASLNKEFS